VAPTASTLDFSTEDALLGVIAAEDRRLGTATRLILVLGARNVSFPELHMPPWAWGLSDSATLAVLRGPLYANYLEATVRRYRADPALMGWQVENEPLDDVREAGALGLALPAKQVAAEVRLVHELDGNHPVVVTTFNSAGITLDRQLLSPLSWLYQRLPGPKAAGHATAALDLGDALGLDLYVSTPSTPPGGGTVGQRIGWKAASLPLWQELAAVRGKALWITELQAAQWAGAPDFEPQDLRASAAAYASSGAAVVLLWGVESWLDSPEWLEAGEGSLALLHGSRGDLAQPGPR
jgi:hypothetical protein